MHVCIFLFLPLIVQAAESDRLHKFGSMVSQIPAALERLKKSLLPFSCISNICLCNAHSLPLLFSCILLTIIPWMLYRISSLFQYTAYPFSLSLSKKKDALYAPFFLESTDAHPAPPLFPPYVFFTSAQDFVTDSSWPVKVRKVRERGGTGSRKRKERHTETIGVRDGGRHF